MDRIIGILMTVCFILGMHMGVSESAKWQGIYVTEKFQYQVDVDSVKQTGDETYLVMERGIKSDGTVLSQALCEYKVEKEPTAMYYGMSRTILIWQDGKVLGDMNESFAPVYPWNKYRAFNLAYLNHTFGDKTVKTPRWELFYSDINGSYAIDTNSITKVSGIYCAWVQVYMPSLKQEGKYPYVNTRMEYKEDAQGQLWVRARYEASASSVSDQPAPWELVEEGIMYPSAEAEFEFIRAYLGEV